jgi:carbonic anhydrase
LFSFLRKEQIRIQKEQEKELRELQRRQAHSKKLEEENRKRKEAEEMIKLLENEERELVNRLRRTQAMQQEVRTKEQTNLTIFWFDYFFYSIILFI